MYRNTIISGIIAWISILCGISQMRTVSGLLTDAEGNPLPGVSVVIKGTQTGTITDVNGYYSIEAPVGSTLVFSFVGFLNKEILVTPESSSDSLSNNQSAERNQLRKSLLSRPGELAGSAKGFASLNQASDYNKNRLIKLFDGSEYFMIHSRWYVNGHAEISCSIDRPVYNLKIQNTYAQGRNLNGDFLYRGPETGEIFSWGPPVKNLEYSDHDYPYDFRGQLVYKGTGNGMPALVFDSLNLFRTGYKTTQNMHVIAGNYHSKIILNYYHTCFSGIIPSSRMQEYHMGLLLNRKIGRKIITDFSLRYLSADARLMNSFSQARIFSMAVRTPVTFDNSNGLNDPVRNSDAYLTPSGAQRSFSPTLADNPFWLINSIDDIESNNKLFGTFKLKVCPVDGIEMYMNAAANSQNASNIYGYKAGTAFFYDRLSIDRFEKYNTLYSLAGTSFNKSFYGHVLNFVLDYQTDYVERILSRTATIDTVNTEFNKNTYRLSHQFKLTGRYSCSKGLAVNFSGIAYHSSTYSKTCWMPAAGMALKLTDWFTMGNINF